MFFLVRNRKRVEIVDDFTAHLFEFTIGRFAGNELTAAFLPFAMQLICRPRYFFVRARAVETAHEDIAKDNSKHAALYEIVADGKARIALEAA